METQTKQRQHCVLEWHQKNRNFPGCRISSVLWEELRCKFSSSRSAIDRLVQRWWLGTEAEKQSRGWQSGPVCLSAVTAYQTDVKMFVASPCTWLTLNPTIGGPVERLDPDPACAPTLRRGPSGVGSEEPRTWGFPRMARDVVFQFFTLRIKFEPVRGKWPPLAEIPQDGPTIGRPGTQIHCCRERGS